MDNKQQNVNQTLKDLTSQDFLNFGIQEIAYIRPMVVDNKDAFVIHAADGTALSVMDTYDAAMSVALHNELEPITIQ